MRQLFKGVEIAVRHKMKVLLGFRQGEDFGLSRIWRQVQTPQRIANLSEDTQPFRSRVHADVLVIHPSDNRRSTSATIRVCSARGGSAIASGRRSFE